MCGRFASFLPPDALRSVFRTVNPLGNFRPSWNVAPRQRPPVVFLGEEGERHLAALQWGLLPYWITDAKSARYPINARCETVASSAMFRDAFARRRCLIPVNNYYEWRTEGGVKRPYAFAGQDGLPLALAGLWESWRGPDGDLLRTFAIITTAANSEAAPYHNRMPVILGEADWALWLGEPGGEGDYATLMRPAPEGTLMIWPVHRDLGNVRNDHSDLLREGVDPVNSA